MWAVFDLPSLDVALVYAVDGVEDVVRDEESLQLFLELLLTRLSIHCTVTSLHGIQQAEEYVVHALTYSGRSLSAFTTTGVPQAQSLQNPALVHPPSYRECRTRPLSRCMVYVTKTV